MARYNGLIIPRSYNDYFSRSDPQAIRDIISLAADGELNAESKNPLQNQAIAKIVPVTASPDNKLIVQSQISGLTADVETIKNIIPNTASETNELADKNFVNSTVGTNTANYIYKTESGGEKVPFSSVAELEAYAGTVTNNDYAFVTGIDENGNAYYDRYKADVNDGVVTWAKEYRLNNSSFTAEQWAAIQSGITAEKVAQFEGAVAPVDVVQSGNMSAVTSNAVNTAIANISELKIALKDKTSANVCIPNGLNKAATFSGTFTDTPYSTERTCIIYCSSSLVTSEMQYYQEVTSYYEQSSAKYGEEKYYRFGYRINENVDIKWGDWERVITAQYLNTNIGTYVKTIRKDYGDITIGSANYVDLGSIIPDDDPRKIVGYGIRSWGTNTGAFNIFSYTINKTGYIVGASGTKITDLKVDWYVM